MKDQQRYEIFNNFLEKYKCNILYDGIRYSMINGNNDIVIRTHTADEMYSYILGFIEGVKQSAKEVSNLVELNKNNVERYENIILNMENTQKEKSIKPQITDYLDDEQNNEKTSETI